MRRIAGLSLSIFLDSVADYTSFGTPYLRIHADQLSFHQDHAASLPYVLAKTNFAGRVYMTHPTKAIYKSMMQDSVRVQNTRITSSSAEGAVHQLFTEQDVLSTLPMINTISFHTTHTHNGIRFTPYPAGHVLGACMYLIEIAGLNILFTGDYSREEDRHLIQAAVPRNVKIDCLITESTFGISTHIPRLEREAALMKSITSILNRGGRALLPVFAMGRAQELLLILEDYWQRHEEYRRYPIYYASSLARKCMVVYQTYIDAMNENIRSKFQAGRTGHSSNSNKDSDEKIGSGPWDFEYIRSLKSLDRFDDVGGCVMLAAPGFLQTGVSRTLLERWAPDPRNGVIITGYSVENTMARTIMLEPDSIPARMRQQGANAGPMMGKQRGVPGGDGEEVMIPRRCTVQEFSFAAHVDGQENREFIEEVDAPVVILVHGEKHNMARLKSRLLSLQKMKVFSPQNCEELRIPFRRDKIARVVGRLANEVHPPTALPSPPASSEDEDMDTGDAKRIKAEKSAANGLGQVVSGVLVQNDFRLSLMAPEDLKEYAGLTTTTIVCRQHITLAAAGIDLIKWALEGTFGSVNTISTESAENLNGKPENGEDDADEELMRDDEDKSGPTTTFEIMGNAVRVICQAAGLVELEWYGNATNDSIADAVMAVLLTVESSPAAVRQSSKSHSHDHSHSPEESYDAFGDVAPAAEKTNAASEGDVAARINALNPFSAAALDADERLNRLLLFLEAQFGEDAITPIADPRPMPSSSEEGEPELDDTARSKELARLHALGLPVPGLEIRVDKAIANLWLEGLTVECKNKTLGDRVKAVVERAVETLSVVWN